MFKFLRRNPPAPEPAPVPHFVRAYRKLAKALIERHGTKEAMSVGVGGNFSGHGEIQAALLRHLGLRAGHLFVDVGCGSGRLASAVGKMEGIRYIGSDVVPEYLEYAKSLTPPEFEFHLVEGLSIPAPDGVADFVTFFSVMTHLHHHESFIYLREAARVLKPGGLAIVSFLEVLNPTLEWHLDDTVTNYEQGGLGHLNAFIEEPVMRLWAKKVGLKTLEVFHAGTNFVPLTSPIHFDDGQVFTDRVDVGQSVAVLQR